MNVQIPEFALCEARVTSNEPVAQGIHRMRLVCEQVVRDLMPAQFLQIQTDPGLSPLLRRPFSALRVDRKAGWVDILYDVIGSGTQRMAGTVPGHRLVISGPHGNPFTPPDADRILLVAGGVGLVPLAFLAWEHAECRSKMIFLMGTAERGRMPDLDALLPEDLERHLATDDGSLGHAGFVTDLIQNYVLPARTAVFTCGPHAMMSRVAAIAKDNRLPCSASLENHMACGFGACVGCVVAYKEAETEDRRYRRVCVEGPVVDAHAILW